MIAKMSKTSALKTSDAPIISSAPSVIDALRPIAITAVGSLDCTTNVNVPGSEITKVDTD
jgi:hypothetical protein